MYPLPYWGSWLITISLSLDEPLISSFNPNSPIFSLASFTVISVICGILNFNSSLYTATPIKPINITVIPIIKNLYLNINCL